MKKQNYQNMFRWDGNITCLHSELFLKGSHGVVDPLIIFSEGSWHTFLNKSKLETSLKKGLELFSNKQKFTNYSASFRNHIQKIKQIKINPKITKEELKELIETLGKLWQFYGFTEFFYTDLAFKEINENPSLKENLEDFGKLKIEGRERLNSVIFEGGLLPQILTSLSKRFLEDEEDAFYLYSDELISLFDNKIPEKKVIEARKKCYAIAKTDNKIIKLSESDASTLAKEFTETIQDNMIKGTVSNKGKARGKVVIAPMLTDMKEVNKVTQKMQKGDILVAQSTTPELMPLCHKAAAIITDQGGMLSHAAIVSRELNIPCIVGTDNATRILKDGDIVEVDAETGIVKKIK